MLPTLLLAAVTLLAEPATQPQIEMMEAVQLHEFGGPDVLKLEQVARPEIGEKDLLVRVYAAGVNPIDWKIRKGPGLGNRLPYIPGFDVSGVVEHAGTSITRFKIGDPVFAMLDLRRGGGYAQYTIVRESEATTKPANLTHIEAAGVPLVALTAWQALFDRGQLDRYQRILIHGGAGGVGSMAVQLAKNRGAYVIATASEENHAFLKSIGADEVIDYRKQKFEEVISNVDVILDTIGGDTQERSWRVLNKGGCLVSIVGPPSQQKARQFGVHATSLLVQPRADQLAQIAKLFEEGKIKPVVSHVFPLADAAKAHEQSETRHTRGKIVLQVIPESPTTQPVREPAP